MKSRDHVTCAVLFVRIKANIGAYGAIDRAFFEEIGAYDEGMQLWGGENIDLSIRVKTKSIHFLGYF
jgi:hypothetical protein